jgi:4-hydroxybenzoate polyprenyltransferase
VPVRGVVLRLVHPFPSLLNGVVVLALASIAGGAPSVAIRLAVAMTLLQMAIGAFNDVADAAADRDHVPPKPIPSGVVSAGAARLVGISTAAAGLLLVAPAGPGAVLVALAGLACGLAYDLGLSRTVASWVPLSLALPLVPVYAWIGATGHLPPELAILVPIGVIGGAGLAIGNALVDVEGDARAGRRTIAVAAGADRAWRLQAGAFLLTVVASIVLLPVDRGPVTLGLVAAGAAALAVGAALARFEVGARRRIAWQLEAGGIAAIAIGWIMAAAAKAG